MQTQNHLHKSYYMYNKFNGQRKTLCSYTTYALTTTDNNTKILLHLNKLIILSPLKDCTSLLSASNEVHHAFTAEAQPHNVASPLHVYILLTLHHTVVDIVYETNNSPYMHSNITKHSLHSRSTTTCLHNDTTYTYLELLTDNKQYMKSTHCGKSFKDYNTKFLCSVLSAVQPDFSCFGFSIFEFNCMHSKNVHGLQARINSILFNTCNGIKWIS